MCYLTATAVLMLISLFLLLPQKGRKGYIAEQFSVFSLFVSIEKALFPLFFVVLERCCYDVRCVHLKMTFMLLVMVSTVA